VTLTRDSLAGRTADALRPSREHSHGFCSEWPG